MASLAHPTRLAAVCWRRSTSVLLHERVFSTHSSRWLSRRTFREPDKRVARQATLYHPTWQRGMATQTEAQRSKNLEVALYAAAAAIALVGLSYASVPLYALFCRATGYGGTTQTTDTSDVQSLEAFKNMQPVEGGRQITVYFNADTSASMPWTFVPQQRAVKVVPGETALAFYTAHNPTDKAITGVSTYNVSPMRAGIYFHKIQCFCFEEQRLRPHEEIDMPVFFYIDPKFLEDPAMAGIRSLTLSYTFFRSDAPEVLDISTEILKQEAAAAASNRASGAVDDATPNREGEAAVRIREWTKEVSALTGVAPASGKQTAASS